MRDPYSIHAKLKVIWAKLTRHRDTQSKTKMTLNMILRSGTAKNVKDSRDPRHQDGSVPPNINSNKYKPRESEENVVNDVEDSDEESLYVRTEAASELGREELEKDAVLMELPLGDPCRFLLLLPREIRDKIYGYVLNLGPISDHKLNFKCMSCPNLTGAANHTACQSQIYEARNLLRTCHQIRDEGKQVFFEVNSWSLNRAKLRENPPGHSSATTNDTQMLFDRMRQITVTKHFKHVNIRISLSPLAYCDFTVPDSVALDDPVAVHLFELTQRPSVIAYHKLNETAQCELFRATCNGLVKNRADVFPKMKSVTVEVSLHAKKLVSDAPNNPLDRCGITFHVRINLGGQNPALPRYHYAASLPILEPSSVVGNTYLSRRARYEAYNDAQHPGNLSDVRNTNLLDPRRRMLSPLRRLSGVQSVEVERRWTVRYHQRHTESGVLVVRAQPLRKLWRFCNVNEMLERAGPGFGEFLDPALEYLKTSSTDVIEIIENTTEDIEYHLMPSPVLSVGRFID